ncbi:uncharacterized protein EKO05_0007532 [Ascochyta rabiei]|uniref:Uncharacterized protein n=1 Tax=Didymella rabiei TaxID=5454 RepID=A0A162YJX2_DIDRA|nr:uncharacterized protein EKO05_0007532 [Ascochyta rabiei]KZM20087.1 hypothetical protein ST47_g8789 [Ascochyta rabiei]UPX17158.1 hypothetical protein EKO05_0007532 [Ascochyta rabiei]
MRDRFRAKTDKKYRPKNWQAMNERADDQIEPAAAVRSVDALQRWALITANITQSDHRPNEAKTMERIQSRYGTTTKTTTAKRKDIVSPTGTLRYGEIYVNNTAEGNIDQLSGPEKTMKKATWWISAV